MSNTQQPTNHLMQDAFGATHLLLAYSFFSCLFVAGDGKWKLIALKSGDKEAHGRRRAATGTTAPQRKARSKSASYRFIVRFGANVAMLRQSWPIDEVSPAFRTRKGPSMASLLYFLVVALEWSGESQEEHYFAMRLPRRPISARPVFLWTKVCGCFHP